MPFKLSCNHPTHNIYCTIFLFLAHYMCALNVQVSKKMLHTWHFQKNIHTFNFRESFLTHDDTIQKTKACKKFIQISYVFFLSKTRANKLPIYNTFQWICGIFYHEWNERYVALSQLFYSNFQFRIHFCKENRQIFFIHSA